MGHLKALVVAPSKRGVSIFNQQAVVETSGTEAQVAVQVTALGVLGRRGLHPGFGFWIRKARVAPRSVSSIGVQIPIREWVRSAKFRMQVFE